MKCVFASQRRWTRPQRAPCAFTSLLLRCAATARPPRVLCGRSRRCASGNRRHARLLRRHCCEALSAREFLRADKQRRRTARHAPSQVRFPCCEKARTGHVRPRFASSAPLRLSGYCMPARSPAFPRCRCGAFERARQLLATRACSEREKYRPELRLAASAC